MTISVNTVENASPQTMAVATGPHIRESPARPTAREKSPAIVVNDVMSIGITLRLAA